MFMVVFVANNTLSHSFLFADNSTKINKEIITQEKSLQQNSNPIEDAQNTADNNSTSKKQDRNNNNQNKKNNNNDSTVVLNFENADIQVVIKAISKISGKNFVIDPKVKGIVNIISDKPVSKADSYKILSSALKMQGFATIEADGVIKVLPESEAKTYGMTVQKANVKNKAKSPGLIGDQLITRIFFIEYGSATQILNTIKPIVASSSYIANYQSANALIITDYTSNLEKISKLIYQLDNSNNIYSSPEIISLKYAVANDVAQVLQSYLGSGNLRGGGLSSNSMSGDINPSITVDVNSNSVIISSANQNRKKELRELAEKLDNTIESNNNNMHVVYLRNADSNHIADVLRAVASGQENTDLTASSSRAQFDTQASSMFGGMGGGASPFGGSKSSSNSRSSSSSSRNNNSNSQNDYKVFIQAEPTTNSLIIQAPENIYRNLRLIIDMLDIRRVQISLEALIADVILHKAGSLGIQWAMIGGNKNTGGGIINNYGDPSFVNAAATGFGINAAKKSGSSSEMANIAKNIPNKTMIGVYGAGGSIAALADMIASNNAGNVIARSTVTVLDNEEAIILEGTNLGIPTGQFNPSTGGSNVNFERKTVGTQLKVKPLITQDGVIQLKIFQEDSSVDQTTISNPAGPSFKQRMLQTSLLVDNGQIIGLGGMTRDDISIVKRGIPYLSDIPYIGWLFSWQSRSHQKHNLMLFLKPVIIRDQSTYTSLTRTRYDYLIRQQNAIGATGGVLPDIKPINVENQLPDNFDYTPIGKNNLVTDLPIVDLRGENNQLKNQPNLPNSNSKMAYNQNRINPQFKASTNSYNQSNNIIIQPKEYNQSNMINIQSRQDNNADKPYNNQSKQYNQNNNINNHRLQNNIWQNINNQSSNSSIAKNNQNNSSYMNNNKNINNNNFGIKNLNNDNKANNKNINNSPMNINNNNKIDYNNTNKNIARTNSNNLANSPK